MKSFWFFVCHNSLFLIIITFVLPVEVAFFSLFVNSVFESIPFEIQAFELPGYIETACGYALLSILVQEWRLQFFILILSFCPYFWSSTLLMIEPTFTKTHQTIGQYKHFQAKVMVMKLRECQPIFSDLKFNVARASQWK